MTVDNLVPRRKTNDGDIDIKKMMKTPVGRWAIVPALVGILAIFAWGLILTLINLQNGLPQWVYGAPGLPAVVLYYIIQLRKLWHNDIKPDLTIAKDSNISKPTVKGNAIAPNIQGDNLVVNQTFNVNHHHSAPRTETPATTPITPVAKIEPEAPAAPASAIHPNSLTPLPKPAPGPVRITLKEAPAKPQPRVPEVIHDGPVKVKAADREMIEFVAEKGDRLKGTVFATAPLFAWIWTEEAVAKYHGTKSIGASLICDNTPAGVIDIWIPESGRYYLILDTKGKQSGRNVLVRLEKIASLTA